MFFLGNNCMELICIHLIVPLKDTGIIKSQREYCVVAAVPSWEFRCILRLLFDLKNVHEGPVSRRFKFFIFVFFFLKAIQCIRT
jgi:hypothetical protein